MYYYESHVHSLLGEQEHLKMTYGKGVMSVIVGQLKMCIQDSIYNSI